MLTYVASSKENKGMAMNTFPPITVEMLSEAYCNCIILLVLFVIVVVIIIITYYYYY